MWPKKVKNYPEDTPLVQQKIEAGKGISGCEMHELNGWGESYHRKRSKHGVIVRFLLALLGANEDG